MLQTERSVLVCQREKGGHDAASTELPLVFSHLSSGPHLEQREAASAAGPQNGAQIKTACGRDFICWPVHSYCHEKKD